MKYTFHLLISSRFFFIIIIIYQVGCISYRPPYNFVRIAFIIYLFIIIRWAVSNTDHLMILLKLPLFIIYYQVGCI